jgi:cell division septal protein FtsQ
MKLKNRDWTEQEQKLRAASAPILQQARTVRTALLFIVIFGAAALAWVIAYLAWPD